MSADRWPTLRARLALLGLVAWRSDDDEPTFFVADVARNLVLLPDLGRLESLVERLEAERTLALADLIATVTRRLG